MNIQVQFSIPDAATATKIANILINERLAACVQTIGPIISTYHWEGQVEQGEEYLCLVKTTKDLYAALEKRIVALHPYEVPEIIGTAISLGLPAYLKWIQSETARD